MEPIHYRERIMRSFDPPLFTGWMWAAGAVVSAIRVLPGEPGTEAAAVQALRQELAARLGTERFARDMAEKDRQAYNADLC